MSEHCLSDLHHGCALCGEEWPCRAALMQEAARRLRDDGAQLAAERARAERAEKREDVADARYARLLTWTARLRSAVERLHKGGREIADTATRLADDLAAERQRAEAAEAELAQYKPNPADDIGPCKRCDLTVSKWELLGVSEQKHDVCYALDLAEAKVATTAANAEKVAILLMETPTPADLEAATKRAEAAEGREARLREAVQTYVDRYGRTSDDGWRPSFQGLRAALAGTPDPNERAAQLIQAMSRDCAGCWRCQPESHPQPPGLKTRRAGTPEDLPSTTPRESHTATIIVAEVRRGEPTVYPDEVSSGVRPDIVLEDGAKDEPRCTEARHIVLPSGEGCVCGENRSELLL